MFSIFEFIWGNHLSCNNFVELPVDLFLTSSSLIDIAPFRAGLNACASRKRVVENWFRKKCLGCCTPDCHANCFRAQKIWFAWLWRSLQQSDTVNRQASVILEMDADPREWNFGCRSLSGVQKTWSNFTQLLFFNNIAIKRPFLKIVFLSTLKKLDTLNVLSDEIPADKTCSVLKKLYVPSPSHYLTCNV